MNQMITKVDKEMSGAGNTMECASVARVSTEIQIQIGRQLRKVYGSLAQAPLPAQFDKLLERLSQRESRP